MKKTFAIAVAVALLVGITALAYSKAPKKATGGVELTSTNLLAYKLTFNAHEDSGTKPAKGVLNLWRSDGTRRFRFDVQLVRVDEKKQEAYFAGPCTYDSNGTHQGLWFYVNVYDAGSPGTSGDTLGWSWPNIQGNAQTLVTDGTPSANTSPITSGNLVVHF